MNLNLFDLWNQKKKKIQTFKNDIIVYEREIWLASLGQNLGIEINGKNENFIRPVLIYKKYNARQCFIFPLTRQGKINKFYYNLSKISFLGDKSFLSLSQGRTIDTKRNGSGEKESAQLCV